MPIFDTSRIRRAGLTVDQLADEIAAVLDAANKGIQAPITVRCEGSEPALKVLRPDADPDSPVVQVRSGLQTHGIPAWPSAWNPNPVDRLADPVPLTPAPLPPPWGQAPPVVANTSGATAADPQEEGWWQPPLACLGEVVSGSAPSWVVDAFLADPTGDPYMRLTATDLNNALALSAGDWVTVVLTFPASLEGGCVAYIAQG